MGAEDTETLYTALLEGSLELNQHGKWYHNGTVVSHKRLQLFLHRHIIWDDELSRFVIRYGKGRATFSYDRYVYFVDHVSVNEQELRISLLDGHEEFLDTSTLCSDENNRLSCTLKNGHTACFLRSPHQVLLQFAVTEDSFLIGDKTITLSGIKDRGRES